VRSAHQDLSRLDGPGCISGSDHLTASWKVAEGVCAHIDIREEKKENAFSLGRSLIIDNEVGSTFVCAARGAGPRGSKKREMNKE